MNLYQINKLMLKDLAASGSSAKDAVKMQVKAVTAEEMNVIFKGAIVPAYEIPYFLPDGTFCGFKRYKLLEDYIPKGSNGLQNIYNYLTRNQNYIFHHLLIGSKLTLTLQFP